MNTAYIEGLTTSIENAESCSVLAKLAERVAEFSEDMTEAINAQLALLQPLIAAPGANLEKLATYCEALVAYFAGPAGALVTQLAELTAAVAGLTAAIAQKASELGCGG